MATPRPSATALATLRELAAGATLAYRHVSLDRPVVVRDGYYVLVKHLSRKTVDVLLDRGLIEAMPNALDRSNGIRRYTISDRGRVVLADHTDAR